MFFQDEPMWSASGLLDQQMLPAPYSAATDELPVTAAARRALEEERDRLRGEKLRHFPERLRLAREFGDPADNDEYLAIREEEAVIDARLAQLESILSRTQIVDSADPGDTVAIGSTVTVLDLNSRQLLNYVVDSAHAPFAAGAVSAASPVGRALLGRTKGDRVTIELPRKGATRALEVLDIEPASQ